MNQLQSRKDGWLVAGWRKGPAGNGIPTEVVLSERFVDSAADTGTAVFRRVAAKVAERIDAAVE